MKAWINWLILGICGLILIVAVVLVDNFLVPWAIRYQIGNSMALKNGSEAWERWTEVPVPIYLKVYLLNVENPVEVIKGAKPKVREIGPYVYRESRKKYPIKINKEEDTIEYNQTLTFTFDKSKSGELSETDIFTTINPAINVVMQMVESLPLVMNLEAILDFGLPQITGETRYSVFANFTVKEFLWDGLPVYCNHTKPTTATRLLCSSFSKLLPAKLIFSSDNGNYGIALFNYKNGTRDGPYEVGSGVSNPDDLGRITKWKGTDTSYAWSGRPCNKIRGSDSALLPLFIEKDDDLHVFSSDICASVKMKYKGKTDYKGISGYTFAPNGEFLGSVEDYKDNYCFCPGSIKKLTCPGGCLKKGAIDASSCLLSPAIITFPHFLGADKYYTNLVEGLIPDEEKHKTFIDLEPNTGVPLRGYQRVQLNSLLKPTLSVQLLQEVALAVIPVVWIEESFELPEDLQQMLRDQLLKVLKIVLIVKWVIIACGIVMALVGFGMSYYRKRNGCFKVS